MENTNKKINKVNYDGYKWLQYFKTPEGNFFFEISKDKIDWENVDENTAYYNDLLNEVI